MASVTKESDGTFSVNPQGDTEITLATENTYLDKNIVFNVQGGGTEVITNGTAPISTTKLKINPEIEEIEVLTSEDLSKCCNPNILDNWLFTKEYRINQRKRADNSSCPVGEYVVDRWQNFHGSLFWLDDNAIVLFPEDTSKWAALTQFIPNLPAGKYTASVLGQYGDFYTHTFDFIPNSDPIEYSFDGVHKLAMGTTDGRPYLNVIVAGTSSVSFHVKAVKLELGSQQTLCHKEGTVWTLNEIPNYAEQLLRCRRYYWRSWTGGTVVTDSGVCGFTAGHTNSQPNSIVFPVEMYASPSIKVYSYKTGNVNCMCRWSDDAEITGVSVSRVNSQRAMITKNQGLTSGVAYAFHCEAIVAGYGG